MKKVINKFSTIVPLELLIHLSGQKIFLPFYHMVSDESPEHVHGLYQPRSIENFILDLSYLTKHFTPVDAYTLNNMVRSNQNIDRPVFHMSFDDGLVEVYEIIAPILNEKKIPATFFINPSFINDKDIFYRYKAAILASQFSQPKNIKYYNDIEQRLDAYDIPRAQNLKNRLFHINYQTRSVLLELSEILGFKFDGYLANRRIYMNENEITQLANDGFTIGCHSMDHPWYKDLVYRDQLTQTKKSADYVKKHIAQSISLFSFPFSDERVSTNFFDDVFENEVCDLTFGISGLKKDYHKCHLHRFPMEEWDQSPAQMIKGEYLYYLLKAPLKKNAIIRNK